MRVTERTSSFDRELWEMCDRPAWCDLTRGDPGPDCSCTDATGCTYLGAHTTCGPSARAQREAGYSARQARRVEEGW